MILYQIMHTVIKIEFSFHIIINEKFNSDQSYFIYIFISIIYMTFYVNNKCTMNSRFHIIESMTFPFINRIKYVSLKSFIIRCVRKFMHNLYWTYMRVAEVAVYRNFILLHVRTQWWVFGWTLEIHTHVCLLTIIISFVWNLWNSFKARNSEIDLILMKVPRKMKFYWPYLIFFW